MIKFNDSNFPGPSYIQDQTFIQNITDNDIPDDAVNVRFDDYEGMAWDRGGGVIYIAIISDIPIKLYHATQLRSRYNWIHRPGVPIGILKKRK